MKKKVIIFSVFAIVVVVSVGAFAKCNYGQGRKGQRPTAEQIIEKLDVNGDGQIDKQEAEKAPKGRLSEKFELIDIDKNGLISGDELKNRPRPKKAGLGQ